MPDRLTIVTAYSDQPLLDTAGEPLGVAPADFLKLWFRNTLFPDNKYALHHRVCVINAGGKEPADKLGLDWIAAERLTAEGDDAWTASFVLACLLAHHNGSDLLFKSLDCLAFGPWIDRLYSELAGAHVVGDQSLMLVKCEGLLPLAGQLLTLKGNFAAKIGQITESTGNVAGTLMGVGKDRPINFDSKPFYVSRLSAAELVELRKRKLV